MLLNPRTPRSGFGTGPSSSKRRPFHHPASHTLLGTIFDCAPGTIVWTLVGFWTVWILCTLTIWYNPSILDPFVHRRALASAEFALAHEHDGPNHRHGLPGMIILPHSQHHHEGGEQEHATPKEVAKANKIGEAVVAAIADKTTQTTMKQKSDSASSSSINNGKTSAAPTSSPPRVTSSILGATILAPGVVRSTPGGDLQCPNDHSSGDDVVGRRHTPFEQFSIDPDAPHGTSDDYTSDEAPLRQLEVTSVNKYRSKFEWGPTTKQKGILVYMCTSEPEDIQQLQQSLSAIQSSFISHYDYPIAIFHEDFSTELQDAVQASAETTFIYFVKIRFQLPKHLKPLEGLGIEKVRHRIPNPQHPTGFHEHEHGLRPYVKRAAKYPYGYQHMCRFFSGAGFMLPFFDAFDWYWRLDSDTVCHGHASHDIFDHLSSCGLEYSYLAPIFGDGGDVVEGLWNAAVNYTETRKIKPFWMFNHHKYNDWGEKGLFSVVPSFNTNCEVASLSFLRSKEVQEFHRYLDEKGGYFLHRWGDAPVRFLGVSMNIPEKKTEPIHGIQCVHT